MADGAGFVRLTKKPTMIILDNKFSIGDRVYLETDVDQQVRIVTGLYFRKDTLTYGLSCGTTESWHYDFEICVEKNVIIGSNS